MSGTQSRTISFQLRPQLLTRQLGRDLYSSPSDALSQLIANCLDAGCDRVDVMIHFNGLDTPELVEVIDDGRGISPGELDEAFGVVGVHTDPPSPKREIIGSRGIGRFAVYALAAESRWETVADDGGSRVRQRWVMGTHAQSLNVMSEQARDVPTGTTITLQRFA